MATVDQFPTKDNYGDGAMDGGYQTAANASTNSDMASMVAAAASQRNKRVSRNGGKVKMRAVTAAPHPPPPRVPDKQDFAAIAAAAASQRKNRIQSSGGTLQITQVRDIPEEHANVFVSVAEQAAKMGRLVRSNEQVVEATSERPEETDTWTGPGGLKNHQNRRSVFERAISEAAALGRMKTSKPEETTNYDNHRIAEQSDDEIDIDKQVDEQGRRALRTHFLLDQHVREEYREKKNKWSVQESFEGPDYVSIDDVELPTEQAPTFKPKDIKFMTQREALEALSNAVAVGAWERNYRLQRPKSQLKVTRGCTCPYCKNPNPYQTHKYKAMMSGGDSSDDDLSTYPQAPQGHQNGPHSSNVYNLEPVLKPPEGKIYRLANPNADEEETVEEEEDPIPAPTRRWEPPNRPKAAPSPTNVTAPCSIYEIRPAGDLQPMQHPDADFQSPDTHPDIMESLGEDNRAFARTADGGYHASSHTGTKVLLDEYVDFGTVHRKVHIKREKTKKEQKKKKPEKVKRKEGCTIM